MNTILSKILEILGSRMADQPAMGEMTEMERITEMQQMAEKEQQEHKSNDMAPVPGEMEIIQMQPAERQTVMDEDMQAAMETPGSMMVETRHSAGGSGMVTQDQSKDSQTKN